MKNYAKLSRNVALSLVLGTSVAWGGTALAEGPLEFTMEDYVVTATRTPVETFKARANISVITSKQIEDHNYKDLYTALRDVPGVQTYSYGQAGYLTSNGFRINGSNKVVILIDGIRANQASEIYSTGTIANMENIERIEILKGAASALYGADAQGGVVNIITKKTGNQSKIFFNTGNYGTQNYGGVFNIKADKLGIHATAKKSKEGDFKSAKGERIFSNGESNNFNVGLDYELKENSTISVNYDVFNNRFNYVSPGLANKNSGKFDSTNARMVWNHEFDKDTHNVFSLATNRRAYVPYWGPATYRSTLVQEQFSKNIADTHLLTMGVDYEGTEVIESTTPRYNGTELNTTAVFLQDQISLTDKLTFTAGVRFTDPNAFDSVWTPSFNLGYEFDDNTNTYIAWSKFFNTPSLSQLYDGKYGNADLKPENGKNFEIGVNHRFSDDFTASAHYFYRTTTDALAYDYGAGHYYNKSEEAKAKGFDIQLKKRFQDHFTTSVGYTYLNMPATGAGATEAANVGGFMPRSAWNINMDYTNRDLVAGLTGRGIIHKPGYYSPAGKAFPDDTYWVWDLNMSYKVKKNIRLYANVYNLFDQYYAENSDVYWQNLGWGSLGGDYQWWPMPGRTFLVGLEYLF